MENLFWTGYSNDERLSTISMVERVVSMYGDIVDFKLFSDISVTVTIEIEESRIDNLHSELANYIVIDRFGYLNSVSKRERTIFLNISFARGTGDLNIETPSVPG